MVNVFIFGVLIVGIFGIILGIIFIIFGGIIFGIGMIIWLVWDGVVCVFGVGVIFFKFVIVESRGVVVDVVMVVDFVLFSCKSKKYSIFIFIFEEVIWLFYEF